MFVILHRSPSCIIQYFDSTGANKTFYAPEPFDVGRVLQVDIVSHGQKVIVTTSGPIEPGWC
jgi:hypothetical protein